MKITKQLAILSVFILVLPQSVQAMRQKRKMAAEKQIKRALELYRRGAMTSKELQKRVDPLIKSYPEFKKYDPKKVSRQQQEKERLEAERLKQEKERLEAERLKQEKERLEAERLKQERLQAERLAAEKKVNDLTVLLKKQYGSLIDVYTKKGYTVSLAVKIREIARSIDDTYLLTQQELDTVNEVVKIKLFKVVLKLKDKMILYANEIDKVSLKKAMYTSIIGFINQYNNVVFGKSLDVSGIPKSYFEPPTQEEVEEQRKRDEEARKRQARGA